MIVVHQNIIYFCQTGKIKLPLLKENPPILDYLLNSDGGHESLYYKKNIRKLNSMLAFTSFGADIDSNIHTLHGPYVFKISGQVHHLLGSLLPTDGKSPRFAQLYIHDTDMILQDGLLSQLFKN